MIIHINMAIVLMLLACGCSNYPGAIEKFKTDPDSSRVQAYSDYKIGTVYQAQTSFFIENDPGYRYPIALNPDKHRHAHDTYSKQYTNSNNSTTGSIAKVEVGDLLECTGFALRYHGALPNRVQVIMRINGASDSIMFDPQYVSLTVVARNYPFGHEFPEAFEVPRVNVKFLSVYSD